jgi:hypothetical protein
MDLQFPDFYYEPSEGIYQHYAWAKNGKVLLCNDSDGEYEQIFGSREELQRFVDHLQEVADEAWPDPDLCADIAETLERLQDINPEQVVFGPSMLNTDITEEENERRFKEALQLIENVTHEQLVELMGEEFFEEFRRVSRR